MLKLIYLSINTNQFTFYLILNDLLCTSGIHWTSSTKFARAQRVQFVWTSSMYSRCHRREFNMCISKRAQYFFVPFWAIFWRRSEKKVEKNWKLHRSTEFDLFKMNTEAMLWRHKNITSHDFFVPFTTPMTPKTHEKVAWRLGAKVLSKKSWIQCWFVWHFNGFV